MRILFELTHTAVDYEIFRSGHDYSTIYNHWDESERPKPPNLALVSTPDGDYDVLVVGTEHGLRTFARPGHAIVWKCLTDFGRHRLPQIVMDKADAVVFPCSETVWRWGMRHDKRSIVIEHAVDSDTFCGWRGDGHDVLSVGNMIPSRPEKGPDVLNVVDARVPVHLLGFGNEAYARAIGHSANRMDLAEKYRQYKVYFNPCNVTVCAVLEAMATGMPVVTMRPHNFTDLMVDGRNCLMADTPQEAVDAIKKLLGSTELRRRIGDEARASVRDRLAPSVAHHKWGALYESLMEKVGA